MEELDKLRKKIRKEAEKNIEIEESDIPVHEKFVREEHIRNLKKSNKKFI